MSTSFFDLPESAIDRDDTIPPLDEIERAGEPEALADYFTVPPESPADAPPVGLSRFDSLRSFFTPGFVGTWYISAAVAAAGVAALAVTLWYWHAGQAIRIRFQSAVITQQGNPFSPDPYVVVLLNNRLLFVTPENRRAQDTYEPKWDVLMDNYFYYDVGSRDELTILVMDGDSDILKEILAMVKSVGYRGVTVELNGKAPTFNKDDTLGHWSGKIPAELLQDSSPDVPWELTFTGVNRLTMSIERR